MGATYPEEARSLRVLMPEAIFLVPGYGSQGATAADVLPCFNPDGYGALVNSSRRILFAYRNSGDERAYARAARDEALEMSKDLLGALREAGICPW